jgi:hypothetical protein
MHARNLPQFVHCGRFHITSLATPFRGRPHVHCHFWAAEATWIPCARFCCFSPGVRGGCRMWIDDANANAGKGEFAKHVREGNEESKCRTPECIQ